MVMAVHDVMLPAGLVIVMHKLKALDLPNIRLKFYEIGSVWKITQINLLIKSNYTNIES